MLRSSGEVPRLDESGIYIAGAAGVRQRALADGRLPARLPQPAGVHDVMPSPDGRRWLMNGMPDDTLDRIYLGEPHSGAVQALRLWASRHGARSSETGWCGSSTLGSREPSRAATTRTH